MAAISHLPPAPPIQAGSCLALGRSNGIIAKLFKEMAALNLTKINVMALKQ